MIGMVVTPPPNELAVVSDHDRVSCVHEMVDHRAGDESSPRRRHRTGRIVGTRQCALCHRWPAPRRPLLGGVIAVARFEPGTTPRVRGWFVAVSRCVVSPKARSVDVGPTEQW